MKRLKRLLDRAQSGDFLVTISVQKPRIGIYDTSRTRSGPSRYVTSLLSGIDLEEFDVVIFGNPQGPHTGFRGISVIDVAPVSKSPQSAKPDARQPNTRSIGGTLDIRNSVPSTLRLWLGFARRVRQIASKLKANPVDLFHTNEAGCEESPVAARLAGIPAVLGTFHVDSTYDLEGIRSGLGHRTLEYVSNRCLHKAIGVSAATGVDWIKRTRLSQHRVTTIYNGIDPELFGRKQSLLDARKQLGLPTDPTLFWIGGVGRLDPAKGFSDLLIAVSQLAPRFENLRVAIAGSGPLKEQLVDKSVELGICDRIHWLGFQENIQCVYDALDVFVLSSWCEALPYAVLEAMATGLPVIGTRVGGVPEMIVQNETGELVDSHSPSNLAEAIACLVTSSELRTKLGRAGKRRVDDCFREQDMCDRTFELYRTVLGKVHRNKRKHPHALL